MTRDQHAARRIMDQFGEGNRIPVLDIEEADVGLLIGLAIGGLFITGLTGIESLALPVVVASLGLGVALIFVSPDNLNAWRWVNVVVRYAKRPDISYSASTNPKSDTDEKDSSTGGVIEYTPFTPEERTQDLTNLERAWPGAGAIQRVDGTMEAYIEVKPGNMDFAMSADWAELQKTGEAFANTELDSKLTFHATSRSFPLEQLTSSIDDRLSDDDVTENPIFQELLEEYHSERPRAMRDRGVQQIRYYLGVEVSPLEVYNRYRDEKTPAEKLTQFPVIGFLFNGFVTRRESFTETERRVRQLETLDNRVTKLQTELIQPAAGWSARRLSTVELFVLNMEFWNGFECNTEEPESFVREHAVIGNSSRGESVDA